MRALVLGSGAREHALTWALARSASVESVHAAPGNPGIGTLAPLHELDVMDNDAVVALARRLGADLVVVGPEGPVVNGVADALRTTGIATFGPGRDGARLEGSKAWMKELLQTAGVPTARHATFSGSDLDAALAYLDTMSECYVVKTDGLAAGKGVVVTESVAEARDAVRGYLSGEAFGDAGRTCVIEEGLSGPELSLFVLCDGRRVVPLAPSQDFKRIGDGDVGPNTGGMGAYSPVPTVADDVVGHIMDTAVEPTVAELRRRDIDYRGVLYAGLMLTPDGPKMLEYNARFGDPETQVVLPRLTSDLGVHLHEAATGSLQTAVSFGGDAAVTVVLASEGYPLAPRTGDVIEGLAAAEGVPDVIVFHAGTRSGAGGEALTAGGRVLSVTALGADLAAARTTAYEAAGRIRWPGRQMRRDIARRAAEAAT